jgi:hypothetical protein
VILVLILLLVVVVVAGNWMLTMVPSSDMGQSDQWPSKVVGPSCQQIARERHIPQDLADHTCEAIKS